MPKPSRPRRWAHAYPWGKEAETHPHTSVPEPSPKNDQAVQRGDSAGSYYRKLAPGYGELREDRPSSLSFYDYKPHEPSIDEMVAREGYEVYIAGGAYGRPDLERRNYTTGHLMIYDPTPGQGGDFDDEAATRTWRKVHELAHAQVLNELNQKYGEGRRMGKLGWHRTLREAKRAVEWEWLTTHRQRALSKQLGVDISDEDFAREVNVVMHDAVHRAVTGKFTNPDEEGFHPSSTLIPLEYSLQQLEDYAYDVLGLAHEDALLTSAQKQQLKQAGQHFEVSAGLLRQANKKLRGFERNIGQAVAPDAIAMLKDLDPQGKKGYLNWLIDRLRAHVGEPPDSEKVLDVDAYAGEIARALGEFDTIAKWTSVQVRDLSDFEALEAATREANARFRAEPRAERAKHTQLTPNVIRFDNKDAACLLAGGSTDWCFAKWHASFWESYTDAGKVLYQVTVNGERYGVAVFGKHVVEIKDADNDDVSAAESQAVVQELNAAGLDVENASEWDDYGLDPADWPGWDAGDASHWNDHGFGTADEADSWRSFGFDAEEARTWSDATSDFLSAKDVHMLVQHGIKPAEYAKWTRDTDDERTVEDALWISEHLRHYDGNISQGYANLRNDPEGKAFIEQYPHKGLENGREQSTIGYVLFRNTDEPLAEQLAVLEQLISPDVPSLLGQRLAQGSDLQTLKTFVGSGLDPSLAAYGQDAATVQAMYDLAASRKFHPGVANEWLREVRYDPVGWFASGVVRWQATIWARAHWTAAEAKPWIDAGWTDPEAAARERREQRRREEPIDPVRERFWSDELWAYSLRRNSEDLATLTSERDALRAAGVVDWVDAAVFVREYGLDDALRLIQALKMARANDFREFRRTWPPVALDQDRLDQLLQLKAAFPSLSIDEVLRWTLSPEPLAEKTEALRRGIGVSQWTLSSPERRQEMISLPKTAVRVPLYDDVTAELRETEKGAELVTDTGYAVPVPRESLAHIESDLRRQVPDGMTEGSGNPAVDAVIRGEGELLGKGDDGIVWRVGDQVVKMSTVVPYQPLNRGYRTPEEAEAMLKAQTERAAELADIEGIVVPEFVSWQGKGFQVRPYYELPETWTDEEKRTVQRAVETMWDRGLGLRDDVQVGRGSSGPVLFDIGKAGPIRQSDRFLQDELGPEISALKRWLGGPYKPESRAVLQRQWRDYEKAAEGGIYFEVVEDLLDLAEVERVRSLLGEDEGVVDRLRSLKGERTATKRDPIGMKELRRWLSEGNEFAVLSAARYDKTKSENKQRHHELLLDLQRMGYSDVRQVRGQYFDDERGGAMVAESSVLIPGMTLEDALEVGKKYEQHSIIHKSPDGVIGGYHTDSDIVNLAPVELDSEVSPRRPKVTIDKDVWLDTEWAGQEKVQQPSGEDHWSKSRSVTFTFPIDWDMQYHYPGRALTYEEARIQQEKAWAAGAGGAGMPPSDERGFGAPSPNPSVVEWVNEPVPPGQPDRPRTYVAAADQGRVGAPAGEGGGHPRRAEGASGESSGREGRLVALRSVGYQRYEGRLPDGAVVRVGAEDRVDHGSYPSGRRQRRRRVWVVRVGGEVFGEAATLAAARDLVETAAGQHRVAQNMQMPAKDAALHEILRDANIPYPADFTAADNAYRRWKNQYARFRPPRPIYEGGELDAPNIALSLEGDRRLSGLLHAWERLTEGVRRWDDPRLEKALDVLSEVPGLEGIRLPEWVLAAKAEAAYWQDLERYAARESVGVFIRLSDDLDWPADERVGTPHFTLLTVPSLPDEQKAAFFEAVEDVLASTDPITVELSPGVEFFESHKGETIAHKGVTEEAEAWMRDLNVRLRSALADAGIEVEARDFIPHATLAYLDEERWDGPVPEGRFEVSELEVWGFDNEVPVRLGWTSEHKVARRRKKKTDSERRKRVYRPTWYIREGSQVAWNAAFGVAGLREVTLAPGARVLQVGEHMLRTASKTDLDLAKIVEQQSATIERLSRIVEQLMAQNSGYDAIQTEDRLIVLNPKALEEQPPRKRWLKADADRVHEPAPEPAVA